jgi:hypothetical protein
VPSEELGWYNISCFLPISCDFANMTAMPEYGTMVTFIARLKPITCRKIVLRISLEPMFKYPLCQPKVKRSVI